jgi:hypothetical protein
MGKSRNAIGASAQVLLASGRLFLRGFAMDLVPVLGMILQMTNLGYLPVTVWRPECPLYSLPIAATNSITVDYKYVDETADIAQHYCIGYDPASPSASERRRSVFSEDRTYAESSILSEMAKAAPNISNALVQSHGPDTNLDYSPYALQLSPANQSLSASPHFSHCSHSSQGSRDSINSIHGELFNLDEHEACLMRYFVVELAPWVRT